MNHPNSEQASDGWAALVGCAVGAALGAVLGGVAAWATAPGSWFAAALVVFHVTLAMIVMGVWLAPSLMSKPRPDTLPTDSSVDGGSVHLQLAYVPVDGKHSSKSDLAA